MTDTQPGLLTGDHAYWPCETVRAIADAYGIEVPK